MLKVVAKVHIYYNYGDPVDANPGFVAQLKRHVPSTSWVQPSACTSLKKPLFCYIFNSDISFSGSSPVSSWPQAFATSLLRSVIDNTSASTISPTFRMSTSLVRNASRHVRSRIFVRYSSATENSVPTLGRFGGLGKFRICHTLCKQ